MDKLAHFYGDEATRETIRESINSFILQIGGEWAVSGKDTTGVSDAKKIIDSYFDSLDEKFGKRKERKQSNQAR